MDRMKLLEELTLRIMSYSHIANEELATEIARKWLMA